MSYWLQMMWSVLSSALDNVNHAIPLTRLNYVGHGVPQGSVLPLMSLIILCAASWPVHQSLQCCLMLFLCRWCSTVLYLLYFKTDEIDKVVRLNEWVDTIHLIFLFRVPGSLCALCVYCYHQYIHLQPAETFDALKCWGYCTCPRLELQIYTEI